MKTRRLGRAVTTAKPQGALLRVAAPLLVALVGLTVWYLLAETSQVSKAFLPSPAAVALRIGHDWASGALITPTLITLGEAGAGCIVAVLVALPIGYAMVHSPLLAVALQPFLAASQAVPAVAIAPLLVVWLGYGTVPIAVLCALVVFFPMLLNVVLGLTSIAPELLDAAALDGAHGWSLARHLEWPLASRAVLVGLRGGFTLSITGAVVGEFVMGGNGLGMLVSVYSNTLDTAGLFATILVLCTLAVAIYAAMLAVEHLTDPEREKIR
ncbi:MAG: ABC transporter permease [Propionibacteriaceae bacterium]|jgi:NitT/TauT family transport system permease protein|nr:ABC transporter permease [Propionibacteriaceae bacterium]